MNSHEQKAFYFGAGPAILPFEVLTQIRNELYDFKGSGISILEISHRSDEFYEILDRAENSLRCLMNIPEHYAILFLHGGATTQYSMLPMGFFKKNSTADYVCTGHWSTRAKDEAKKFANINEIDALDQTDKLSIKPISDWFLSSDAMYLHYCNNETINGVAFKNSLSLDEKKIFCDMTSSILTQDIDVQNFALIYASAQKNLGVAGLCVMIIEKSLFELANERLPIVFDYKYCDQQKSMVNTPPIFAIYVLSLMLDWLQKSGGIIKLSKQRNEYAKKIYSLIDSSSLYVNNVNNAHRSDINIPFTINQKLEEEFLQTTKENKLLGLRGHKLAGGCRINLYNAMPLHGMEKLIDVMRDFEVRRV